MPLSPELTQLSTHTLAFMQENWVLPASAYNSMFSNPDPAKRYIPAIHAFPGQAGSLPVKDSLLSMTKDSRKVAWSNLNPQGGGKYALQMYSLKQVPPTDQGDYLPVWFLPWFSDHVTRMTIPVAGTVPATMPDPDIFFTSALTGCSVFIEGPANSPTIYHGGFDSNRDFGTSPRVNDPNTGAEASSIDHWRILFASYGGGAPAAAEVNKGQYMSGGGAYSAFTPDMKAYKRFLTEQHKDEMRIEDMQSEGMVFGMRNGAGAWSFYLQESITLTVYTLRKKKKFLGSSTLVDGQKMVITRPMVVRPIYPTGAGAVTWNTTRIF